MSSLAELVDQSLRELGLSGATRFLVAFSGGLDSTALLLSLQQLRSPLRAIHVNHQLQDSSDAWAEHCERLCQQQGIGLTTALVQVADTAGTGLEAAARQARYAAFEAELEEDEVLVTAHHADDQLETLLLRLARGAGAAGMAGIPRFRRFGRGYLARPLLNIRRQALQQFVDSLGVDWIGDPANADLGFDRSYLRAEVVPALRQRWPSIDVTAARLAGLMAETQGLLDDLAAADLGERSNVEPLPLSVLGQLDLPRRRNALRYWLARCGCKLPSAAQLESLLGMLGARSDSNPVFQWGDHEVRIYRARLYVVPTPSATKPAEPGWLTLEQGWDGVAGRLELVPAAVGGWSLARVQQGFRVRPRSGGERFRPIPGQPSKVLKKWLQEAGVVPWMRAKIPLLYSDDELVAIGDLWQGADPDVPAGQGWCVTWRDRPGLF